MISRRFILRSGCDNHSVFGRAFIIASAVVLFSSPAFCEEPAQGLLEHATPQSHSAPKSSDSQPDQPISRPVPEYAQRAAEALSEQTKSDIDEESHLHSKTGEPLDLMGDDDLLLRQDELRGPGRWFFNTRIGRRLMRCEQGDIRKRPMMYWRRFADRPLPPIGTFLFFSFFNTVICLAFRNRMDIAIRCVRKSFWKSLFVGGFTVILAGSATRLCFDSLIFTPCALLFLGICEFLALCGLAVSSRTIGLALANKLGFLETNKENGESTEGTADNAKGQKSMLNYLVPVMVGTILLTLIALIPGFGPLPRLGTRFVMWFAVLGLGALVRTKLGKKELG